MTSNHLLLHRLAELMLKHEQHVLPVDLLFDDEQFGDFVKSIQIDSPYQQMLLEGVLTETVKEEKLYVCFTVEGYFHFVLGEVIFNQSIKKESQFLLDMIEYKKLNGIKEGVEQCLMKYSKENYLQTCFNISRLSQEINFLVTPTSNYLKSNDIAFVVNYLIKNSQKKEIELFKKSIQRLRDLGNNDCINLILTEIIYILKTEEIKIEPIYLIDLVLSYSTFIGEKDLIELINLLFQCDYKNSDLEKVDFYSNLGFACRLVDRPKDALNFYKEALSQNGIDIHRKVKILGRIAALHSELAIKDKNLIEADLAIKGYQEIIDEIDKIHQFDPLLKATQFNNYAKAKFTYFMYKWNSLFTINEIECLFNESYELIIKNKGMYSDLTAKTLNNLSLFYAMIGDLNKSLELCLNSFKIVKRVYPYFSNDTAIFAFNVGNRYEQLNNFLEAKNYYQIAFDINKKKGSLKRNNQMNTAYVRVLNELSQYDVVKNIESQIIQND